VGKVNSTPERPRTCVLTGALYVFSPIHLCKLCAHIYVNTLVTIQTSLSKVMHVRAPFLCTWEHVFTGICVYVVVKFLLLACEANR